MTVPKLVKDVMEPALELKANKTASDARQILDNNNVSLGVISDTAGKPPTLVKRDRLEKMLALQLDDEMPTEDILHQEPINLDDMLDEVIQTRAKHFVLNCQLSGIVVKAGSTIVGVLSRNKFAVVALLSEYYSEVALSSSDVATLVSREESRLPEDRAKYLLSSSDIVNVSRLEGSAITPLLLYVCLFDCQWQQVAYYNPDPNKRPRCTNDHVMHLIRVRTL